MVGIIDPKLDADSDDVAIRQHSTTAIKQELDWASHLGLQACIISIQASNVNLARVLSQASMQKRFFDLQEGPV